MRNEVSMNTIDVLVISCNILMLVAIGLSFVPKLKDQRFFSTQLIRITAGLSLIAIAVYFFSKQTLF
jgi:hypothetical protein